MLNKSLGKNLISLFIGIVLAFFLLEILLRIWPPIEIRVNGNRIILPVNRSYRIENKEIPKLDREIIHTKNSLGFRGEEPPDNFSDFLTIIAVGGSTTEGFIVSDGKTWIDILGKYLETSFNRVWINNAGLDGHSTFGHLVLMEDYLAKIRPKIVLFLVGGNEIMLEKYNEIEQRNLSEFSARSPMGLFRQLTYRSELLHLLLYVYRHLHTPLYHANVDLTKLGTLEVPEEKILLLKQTISAKYLADYEHRIMQLIAISRANSIEPVFITQPALFGNALDDVTGVDLGKIEVDETNGQTEWEMLELYNDVLRHVGERQGVLVIDLAGKMPKSSIYFCDLYHFNNEGSEKVAEIIYNDLSPFLAQKYNAYVNKPQEKRD